MALLILPKYYFIYLLFIWGPRVEPPVREGEKLAPVMGGIKVR